MSIIAYVGLPGHGKSYGVVENVILPCLKNHRVVFTNIPMNTEKCFKDFGASVVPFDVADIIKNPHWWDTVFLAGAVLVLDECSRLWPAGLKATNVRDEDRRFLAEHRHYVGDNGFSTEIYLIAQDLSQLALFARSLVETTFRMVKRSNIGFDKAFRVDVYSGCVTGSKPPVSQREREIHGGKFKANIYAYYQSHTKSETGGAGNETRTDQRFKALGRLSIKLGFILAILCGFFVYFGFGKVKQQYGMDTNVSSVSQSNVNLSESKTSRSFSSVKSEPQHNRKTIPKFLANAKKLHILYITGPTTKLLYFFKIVFDNYEVTLNSYELTKMGYDLLPINDCVVRVMGDDYSGYFMCAKYDKRGTGFVSALASDVATTVAP